MKVIKKALKAFRARRRWQRLDELSDWIVAPLGAASFLIAGYWSMAISNVLPDLVKATNQHGLTLATTAIFVFLGMLAVTVWFHGHLAIRCNTVLAKRHFTW